MKKSISDRRSSKTVATIAVLVGASVLAGCEPMAITAFGVGASTGVSHSLNGITYRTFTAPASRVKTATLTALNRMGIKFQSSTKIEGGELIKAATPERNIEVELESISAQTTRMRVTAQRNTFLYDSATATEIILQTEKSMGNV